MAGQRLPFDVIEARGAKHMTKAEKAARQAGEVKSKEEIKRLTPPKWLPQSQREEFNRVSAALLKLMPTMVARTDADTIAAYCMARTEWLHATKLVNAALAAGNLDDANGWGLVQDTLSPLLGKKPDPELVNHIRDKILGYDEVLGIHDLMVHDYGPGQQFASVHVEVPADQNVLDCHDMIDNIEKDFLEQDHLLLTIHYDPIVTNDPKVNQLKGILLMAAQEIDGRITIHDLRIVPGVSHTNVVFDCVLPDQPQMDEEEIRTRLTQAVQKEFPTYRCVITLERDFAQ